MSKYYESINKYQSSTIDWCENNYVISSSICEFMNSISSFAYIYLAFFGVCYFPGISSIKNKYKDDNFLDMIKYYSLYNGLYSYYLTIYYIYLLLGLFTLEFHVKLSFLGQVLDEISIMVLLLVLNLDAKISKKRIVNITIISGIMLIYPGYNIYLLLGIGITRWLQLYKTISHNKDIESIYFFIVASFYNLVAIFFWGIDIGLCNHLYISTHFIWHIFSALTLYYYIIYSIWYNLINIESPYIYKIHSSYGIHYIKSYYIT